MNPIQTTLDPSHRRTRFVRLLVSGLLALLLGVFLVLPVLAAGSGTWTVTGSLNNVRDSFAAVLLTNGKVLVSGGEQNGYPLAITSAELYNPSTGTWTNTGSMNWPREYHTMTLLQNGQVLVAGGVNSCCTLASAELYTP